MFIAHEVAVQLIGSLRGSLDRLALKDAPLADQLRRAAGSVLLNIAEGARRAGKDRAHHYRIAAGSAAEVGAALDVAATWGHLDEAALDEIRRLVDRELGLLWGLTHRVG
jgi:four helix bundle protein